LKGKYTFKVNAVSEKAKAAIEAAGGSVEIVK
jgi:large subunit ribosomal protein L15